MFPVKSRFGEDKDFSPTPDVVTLFYGHYQLLLVSSLVTLFINPVSLIHSERQRVDDACQVSGCLLRRTRNAGRVSLEVQLLTSPHDLGMTSQEQRSFSRNKIKQYFIVSTADLYQHGDR